MVAITDAKISPEQVQVTWENGKTSAFLHIWLRDNCRCSECYHAVAEECILNSASIPLDIRPKKVSVDVEKVVLDIAWATDDAHESQIPSTFLEKYSGFSEERKELGYKLWNVADPKRGLPSLPRVSYESVMKDDAGVLSWLETLNTYGFTILEGVPYGTKRVEEVGRRVSVIRNSFWGESSWDVKGIANPTSLSLTGGELFPHTDLCFSEAKPGLQSPHCLEFKAEKLVGGLSTMVDGFFVVEKIRRENPEAFKLLTTQPIKHIFSSKKSYYRFDGPVIALNADGSLKETRFNQALIAPIVPTAGVDAKELYGALQLFANETGSPENLLYWRAQEGEMLVFSNRRMMHGRSAYNAVNTTRHLEGCYVDFEEFVGRLKKLREAHADAA